jgi:DNA-directed RNA polymerase specialized sigma24 family protein
MLHPEFNIDDAYSTIDIYLAKNSKRLQPDSEDLRQEIMLFVMERSREHDPALASWPTFLNRLVKSYIEGFLLARRWRKNQALESLEEIDECDPRKLPRINDVLGGELTIQENVLFACEVREILGTLPKNLKNCAEHLMYYSPAETADILDVPPNVLQRHIQKLQEIFRKAHLCPNHF